MGKDGATLDIFNRERAEFLEISRMEGFSDRMRSLESKRRKIIEYRLFYYADRLMSYREISERMAWEGFALNRDRARQLYYSGLLKLED